MQIDQSTSPGEQLRRVMRHWVTGVAVATSWAGGEAHGMTVNSFGSISLEPPLVTVTMNHHARTWALVEQSGIFAVTLLSEQQRDLAELFAGRMDEHRDRMAGLNAFTLVTGAPLLAGGIACVDCRVVYRYDMLHSTLYVGEVLAAQSASEDVPPLVYHNRAFAELK